jgi:hypothetical protein
VRLAYYSVGIAALTFPKDFMAYVFSDSVNFGYPQVAVMYDDGAMERLSEEIVARAEISQILGVPRWL